MKGSRTKVTSRRRAFGAGTQPRYVELIETFEFPDYLAAKVAAVHRINANVSEVGKFQNPPLPT